MLNRWFTRYVHGIENGVEKEPRVWIVRENDDRQKPTPYPEYPHPNAQPVEFFLEGAAPERGQLSLDKPSTNQTESLVDNFSFDGSALARADWTNHRLMYVSPKLTKPIHISGTARINIRVASSKPAANLSIWLVSLPWNLRKNAKITDNIITRGWADPQNANSLTESEPLILGEFYDLSFDLQPDDQVIPVGQQIGLMIFSSDREVTLHPQPGTELTVDLASTSLMLPIVGGQSKFESAIQMKH